MLDRVFLYDFTLLMTTQYTPYDVRNVCTLLYNIYLE